MPEPVHRFVHRFVRAHESGRGLTLLLLHGMGGDETELLQMGRARAPGAALLSPRGQVYENDQRRFFLRLAKGVFDLEDLKLRAGEPGSFLRSAATWYGFDQGQVLAVGYSNGANMAAALMLLHSEALQGAVLFRPMVPLTPKPLPDLAGKRVLVLGGRNDPVAPPEHSERLARLMQACGAAVALEWCEDGHVIGEDEVERAQRWLRSPQSEPALAGCGE
jgi:predicted esterase